jgi:hypothetical protein
MHIPTLQATMRPDRLPPATASATAAETRNRATPGTLTPGEIRALILEILG